MHSNLSKMKSKILPTRLQRNCRDSLGEFSITSYGVCRDERVKIVGVSCFTQNGGLLVIQLDPVNSKSQGERKMVRTNGDST